MNETNLFEPAQLLLDILEPAGLKLTSEIQRERESRDYCAFRFWLGNKLVVFRVAKITPRKIGQFVTLWKRDPAPGSPIAPLDCKDDLRFVLVCVGGSKRRGVFVFDKHSLIEAGVLSSAKHAGKRALRVYPPWSKPTAKDAIETQQWQLPRFFPFAEGCAPEKGEQDLLKRLFAAP